MATADRDLGLRFGVAASVIQSLRADLTEGLHWTCHAGVVAFTALGAESVAEALGLEKKEGARVALSVPLMIDRVFPNRIWVRVITPDAKAADVRVRDNRRLRRAMKIDCTFRPDGRWECTHAGLAVSLTR